jgi:hypothetical protein
LKFHPKREERGKREKRVNSLLGNVDTVEACLPLLRRYNQAAIVELVVADVELFR